MKYFLGFSSWLFFTLIAIWVANFLHVESIIIGFLMGIAFGGIGVCLGLGIGEKLFS